jgi:hypothetical protein
MQIELKNFKFYPSFSEETNAYTATVYVNGTRAFEAKNDGRGGCDFYTPLSPEGRTLLEEAEAWAKSQPPLQDEQVGELQMDLELHLAQMVEAKIRETEEKRIEKQMRNWCKTKTVFRTPDMPEGQYSTFSAPFSAVMKAHVLTKYPNAEIVNERFQ